MKRDASVRIGNITAHDIVWLTPGKDGELDIHLPEKGYEQYSPLDLVLLGIIRANPKAEKRADSDKSDRQRLKQARAGLLGKSQRDPGLTNADDKILLKVARRVLESIFARKGETVVLAPLIREAASTHYTYKSLKRSEDGENSIIRRLTDHFDKRRDEYLTRVTMRDDYDRASNLTLIHEIFDRLEQLGVKVVREGMPGCHERTKSEQSSVLDSGEPLRSRGTSDSLREVRHVFCLKHSTTQVGCTRAA